MSLLKEQGLGSVYVTTVVVDLVSSYEPVEIMIDVLGFEVDSGGKSYSISCVVWDDTE